MGAIKDKILEVIHGAVDSPQGVKNPDRRDNQGQHLFELFYWQELSKEADTQVGKLWEKAIEERLLKADDYYRNLGAGEIIGLESEYFSCLMKVSSPRKTIDKEKFLAAVAKKAKLPVSTLEKLWEDNQKEGKASLSKRILEV